MIKNLRVTVEKQKFWTESEMQLRQKLGVEAFTVTDLPFSSVLQAYWFLASAILEALFTFVSLFSGKVLPWWQETDSYFFYNSLMKGKSWKKILPTFISLHRKLLDHESFSVALESTPNAIVSIACNARTKRGLKLQLQKVLNDRNFEKVSGLFVVSGGGVFQKYFKKYIPNILDWSTSSIQIINFAKEETNLKIFGAFNPNLLNSKNNNLEYKNVDEYFAQPIFNERIFRENFSYFSSLTKDCTVRAGIPLISSPWNLRFWFMLCGVNWKNFDETKQLEKQFREAWDNDKSLTKNNFKEFSIEWSRNLVKKSVDLYGSKISGIHIMSTGSFISLDNFLLRLKIDDANFELVKEEVKYKNTFKQELAERFFPQDTKKEIILDTKKLLSSGFKNQLNMNRVEVEHEFAPQSASLLWEFNNYFWNNLSEYMQVLQTDYKKTIGGTADSNELLNQSSSKRFTERFLLDNHETVYYLELGAASCDWGKKFIENVSRITNNKNWKYVFIDYSEEILNNAKKQMGSEYLGVGIRYELVNSSLTYEAFHEKYSQRISTIHVTNSYDNFPTDRYLYKDSKFYKILTKLFLFKDDFDKLVSNYQNFGLTEELLNKSLHELSQKRDVEAFLESSKKVLGEKYFFFWKDFWNFIKFEEKYENYYGENFNTLADWSKYKRLEFSSSDSVLGDILDKYKLLKTGGEFEIIDVVALDMDWYKNFLGPVKYDASVANYLNWKEIEEGLKKKNPNLKTEFVSMENFGGRKNQTLVRVIK